ncbi:hypothetical protein HYT92_03585 [Candidatus Pacearchaeota archaeon]|nr:hypothetical protein [Candidatus Pacearchaeota archaeon]
MQTEEKDIYVHLVYPNNAVHICDSAASAVEALDELGICMNWAVISKIAKPGICALFYEGWVFRHTPERYVKLPFEDSPDSQHLFAGLLKTIFKPFLVEGNVHRSVILVEPRDMDCFYANLYLLFDDETGHAYDGVSNVLHDVDDSSEEIKGKVFWLD